MSSVWRSSGIDDGVFELNHYEYHRKTEYLIDDEFRLDCVARSRLHMLFMILVRKEDFVVNQEEITKTEEQNLVPMHLLILKSQNF